MPGKRTRARSIATASPKGRLTIVATTTVGTTLADYCTRSLGIGYTGGSTILLLCVIASLLIWRWSTGSISVETVRSSSPSGTGVFARDDEFVPCSHFFIIEAN